MFEIFALGLKAAGLATVSLAVITIVVNTVSGGWGRRLMEGVVALGALAAVCGAGMVLALLVEAG